MTETADRHLLERLSVAPGPPGAEGVVRDIVRSALEGVGELSYDRLGSILCEKVGDPGGPRVVLDGHMDEVGFMVQSISDEGRIAFVPLGGWWGHVLLAQRVQIMTDSGVVPGVIGSIPPHFLRPEERNQVLSLEVMYIDVGATDRAEAEALGIRVGDPIAPYAEFIELATPGYLTGKAFDDRVGVGLMIEAMRGLERHPNVVIGVGATQEEVGCRGTGTAAELARPDLAIVLEGTPADDLPRYTDRQAILGKGPQIRFFDPTAISNRKLVRFVQEVAAEADIPVQTAVRRTGGTDASTLHRHREGVPTVVIGVPARYIHTHIAVIHWDDYANARRLLLELVPRLDRARVTSFTDFDRTS